MLRKGLLEGERRTRRLTILLVSAITLAISALAFSGGAGAQTDSTAVTIPGNPLTVYVGPLGECQSSYLVHGEVASSTFDRRAQSGTAAAPPPPRPVGYQPRPSPAS